MVSELHMDLPCTYQWLSCHLPTIPSSYVARRYLHTIAVDSRRGIRRAAISRMNELVLTCNSSIDLSPEVPKRTPGRLNWSFTAVLRGEQLVFQLWDGARTRRK